VAAVKAKTGLSGQVFDTEDEAQEHDPIPYALTPPIAHIDRPSAESQEHIERQVEEMVAEYDGCFAGT
jgi:hypothetical protein